MRVPLEDSGFIIEKLRSMNNSKAGYDARKKLISADLISECGVVDPLKVVKSSLRYGSGLASILLTADCAVVDEKYDFVTRVHEQIRL
jgi:chaperonin GroEL